MAFTASWSHVVEAELAAEPNMPMYAITRNDMNYEISKVAAYTEYGEVTLLDANSSTIISIPNSITSFR